MVQIMFIIKNKKWITNMYKNEFSTTKRFMSNSYFAIAKREG